MIFYKLGPWEILSDNETSMNVYRNLDRKEMQFDFIITDGNTVYCEEEIQNLGGKVYYQQNTKYYKPYF